MNRLALLLALLLTWPVWAQDYAREQRWASEILPAVLVGEPVYLKAASGRDFLGLFSEVKGARVALVLVHGVGVHPDHSVIGALRTRMFDLGYTTLSIQMPVAAREASVDDYFPQLFGDAADRMARAGDWLKARGYSRIVLVSHSMGAWMANEYLDRSHASTPYKAWVVMGLTRGLLLDDAPVCVPGARFVWRKRPGAGAQGGGSAPLGAQCGQWFAPGTDTRG